MNIPKRNDNWGLAVDLNALIREASEAQLWLHSISTSTEKNENVETKLKCTLKQLEHNMKAVRAHFKRLGVDKLFGEES